MEPHVSVTQNGTAEDRGATGCTDFATNAGGVVLTDPSAPCHHAASSSRLRMVYDAKPYGDGSQLTCHGRCGYQTEGLPSPSKPTALLTSVVRVQPRTNKMSTTLPTGTVRGDTVTTLRTARSRSTSGAATPATNAHGGIDSSPLHSMPPVSTLTAAHTQHNAASNSGLPERFLRHELCNTEQLRSPSGSSMPTEGSPHHLSRPQKDASAALPAPRTARAQAHGSSQLTLHPTPTTTTTTTTVGALATLFVKEQVLVSGGGVSPSRNSTVVGNNASAPASGLARIGDNPTLALLASTGSIPTTTPSSASTAAEATPHRPHHSLAALPTPCLPDSSLMSLGTSPPPSPSASTQGLHSPVPPQCLQATSPLSIQRRQKQAVSTSPKMTSPTLGMDDTREEAGEQQNGGLLSQFRISHTQRSGSETGCAGFSPRGPHPSAMCRALFSGSSGSQGNTSTLESLPAAGQIPGSNGANSPYSTDPQSKLQLFDQPLLPMGTSTTQQRRRLPTPLPSILSTGAMAGSASSSSSSPLPSASTGLSSGGSHKRCDGGACGFRPLLTPRAPCSSAPSPHTQQQPAKAVAHDCRHHHHHHHHTEPPRCCHQQEEHMPPDRVPPHVTTATISPATSYVHSATPIPAVATIPAATSDIARASAHHAVTCSTPASHCTHLNSFPQTPTLRTVTPPSVSPTSFMVPCTQGYSDNWPAEACQSPLTLLSNTTGLPSSPCALPNRVPSPRLSPKISATGTGSAESREEDALSAGASPPPWLFLDTYPPTLANKAGRAGAAVEKRSSGPVGSRNSSQAHDQQNHHLYNTHQPSTRGVLAQANVPLQTNSELDASCGCRCDADRADESRAYVRSVGGEQGVTAPLPTQPIKILRPRQLSDERPMPHREVDAHREDKGAGDTCKGIDDGAEGDVVAPEDAREREFMTGKCSRCPDSVGAEGETTAETAPSPAAAQPSQPVLPYKESGGIGAPPPAHVTGAQEEALAWERGLNISEILASAFLRTTRLSSGNATNSGLHTAASATKSGGTTAEMASTTAMATSVNNLWLSLAALNHGNAAAAAALGMSPGTEPPHRAASWPQRQPSVSSSSVPFPSVLSPSCNSSSKGAIGNGQCSPRVARGSVTASTTLLSSQMTVNSSSSNSSLSCRRRGSVIRNIARTRRTSSVTIIGVVEDEPLLSLSPDTPRGEYYQSNSCFDDDVTTSEMAAAAAAAVRRLHRQREKTVSPLCTTSPSQREPSVDAQLVQGDAAAGGGNAGTPLTASQQNGALGYDLMKATIAAVTEAAAPTAVSITQSGGSPASSPQDSNPGSSRLLHRTASSLARAVAEVMRKSSLVEDLLSSGVPLHNPSPQIHSVLVSPARLSFGTAAAPTAENNLHDPGTSPFFPTQESNNAALSPHAAPQPHVSGGGVDTSSGG